MAVDDKKIIEPFADDLRGIFKPEHPGASVIDVDENSVDVDHIDHGRGFLEKMPVLLLGPLQRRDLRLRLG